ncbi:MULTISPECIES: hypothetical protein [Pseudomonadaceae]|uniref:hypothetical protein n=1 Tax=Pseudomonadaceae TaxID=135621 RepID=UPI001152D28A|nr:MULTISPECIES: hypothetical protein [Pseudomonas]MCP1620141.1 hypothetical protein [Pseudomonas otitidis]TQL09361.1 hypothetical protein FBY21_4784 [Pseudomonas sp. SLBN-26]WIF66895.1 hypothetical protein QN096_24600 [Pseudomonas otitidis]
MQAPRVPDAAAAFDYLGQTVVMELRWDDQPESIWRIYHVLGLVAPMAGVYETGHFLVLDAVNGGDFPDEIFWDTIRTLLPLNPSD